MVRNTSFCHGLCWLTGSLNWGVSIYLFTQQTEVSRSTKQVLARYRDKFLTLYCIRNSFGWLWAKVGWNSVPVVTACKQCRASVCVLSCAVAGKAKPSCMDLLLIPDLRTLLGNVFLVWIFDMKKWVCSCFIHKPLKLGDFSLILPPYILPGSI